jgi:hypothetical protein
VAIGTWCSLPDAPGFVALNAVVERHLGPVVDTRHGFGDPAAIRMLLEDGGFANVDVSTFEHDVQFADGMLFARLNAMALIGMSEKGKAMSEAERGELAGRVAAESRDLVAGATRNGMFVIPLTSNVAIGRT